MAFDGSLVSKFKADALAMAEAKNLEAAQSVIEIALELRDQAESNASSMLGHRAGAPDVDKGFHAGPVLGPESLRAPVGGAEESKAALANWKPGQPIYVWQQYFYAYFHEYGWLPKGGSAAKPAVGFWTAAVQSIGNREIKL